MKSNHNEILENIDLLNFELQVYFLSFSILGLEDLEREQRIL